MESQLGSKFYFKRGKPFEGIKDVWGIKKYSDLEAIPLLHRNLQYSHNHSQGDLFSDEYYEFGLNARLGKILEIMDFAIRGGIPKSQRRLAKGCNGNTGITCEPDFLDVNGAFAFDTKGVKPSEALMIHTSQLAKYLIIQIGFYFPKTPLIGFDVIRHDISSMDAFTTKNLDELVYELARNIRYGLFLPLSLIYHIHELGIMYPNKGEHTMVSRCNNNLEQDPYTRLKTRGLDSMLMFPEETIRFLGQDPDKYIINKLRYPPNARINVIPIRSYPILQILDKDPESWFRYVNSIDFNPFLEAIERRTETQRERHRIRKGSEEEIEGIIDIGSLKIPASKIEAYREYKMALADSPF